MEEDVAIPYHDERGAYLQEQAGYSQVNRSEALNYCGRGYQDCLRRVIQVYSPGEGGLFRMEVSPGVELEPPLFAEKERFTMWPQLDLLS